MTGHVKHHSTNHIFWIGNQYSILDGTRHFDSLDLATCLLKALQRDIETGVPVIGSYDPKF